LTCRKHVDVKMKKAHNLLWACRRACRARWGMKPKVVHWLYFAITQATISFAFLIWWPGFQKASPKKRLYKVQRLACLGVMGVIHTNRTGAMETFTGHPQLDLVIQGRQGRRHIASGVWGVGLTFIPNKDRVVY